MKSLDFILLPQFPPVIFTLKLVNFFRILTTIIKRRKTGWSELEMQRSRFYLIMQKHRTQGSVTNFLYILKKLSPFFVHFLWM